MWNCPWSLRWMKPISLHLYEYAKYIIVFNALNEGGGGES